MRKHQELKLLGRYAIFSKQQKSTVTAKKENSASQQVKELHKVIDPTHEVLLEVSSVFPFMLFPDSLKIDRQKVMITHRTFFRAARIINIQIEDLQGIEADMGPLFGTISITTKQFENTVHQVHALSRADTMMAQSILQGFILATKEELDYFKIASDELVRLLKELGKGTQIQ